MALVVEGVGGFAIGDGGGENWGALLTANFLDDFFGGMLVRMCKDSWEICPEADYDLQPNCMVLNSKIFFYMTKKRVKQSKAVMKYSIFKILCGCKIICP